MIINFQNSSLVFVEDATALPVGVQVMEDDDLEACFDALTLNNGDIFVNCKPGWMRRLLAFIKQRYIFVKAAGGLVVNSEGKRLLMERNGRADLPKGKVEAGETLKQAALRETNEETGLQHLTICNLQIKTYHIYNLYGGWHFKQTSWFNMTSSGNHPMTPQLEEGITKVEWVNTDTWRQRLSLSYATMKTILASYSTNN